MDPEQPVAGEPVAGADHAGRAALRALADANAEATWGVADHAAGAAHGLRGLTGVLTGDVGPKGQVAAQLRDLSRAEREVLGEVPRGTVVSGGGRLLLALVGGIVGVCTSLVVLLEWLTR